MTPRISYNEKLTIKSNKQAVDNSIALFTAANLPATLSPLVSGRGAVQPRVVTKPNYTNPGVRPTVPPIVRDPKVKPQKKITREELFKRQTPRDVEAKTPQTKVKTQEELLSEPGSPGSKSPTTPKANQAKREADTGMDSGGVSDQALQQVKTKIDAQVKSDSQGKDMARELLSRPANQRGEELKTTVIENPDGTTTEVRAPANVDPKDVYVESFGPQASAAGISQYTLLNGPENNTIIVQPSGGGMPPPPAQPPQMIAQAPPLDMQMMGGGPSKLDQALTLNTLIIFTKLTS